MPRKRTGSIQLGPDGTLRARVTVTTPDGKTSRPWYSLGTTDPAAADRKLARLLKSIEAGAPLEVAGDAAGAPDTFAEYSAAWLARREELGVAMVRDERSLLKNNATKLDPLPLVAIRPPHVRAVLEAAVARGLAKHSLVNLRALLHRLFKAAWQDELIETNPVDRVATPAMREVTRPRAILTDEEIGKYLACPEADLALRLMSMVARVEGGMRTSDVNRWDWGMIDTLKFAACIIPRSKTGKPQPLEVPAVLRPFLRAWWERSGRPDTGPVFPVRRGPRAGEFKAERGISYAAALRRDLKRAKVAKKGSRRWRELFEETEVSRPVDFHSFRRAFSSALAAADVNVQRAMHLASHSDPKVHSRYVMATEAMRIIPPAAVPRLPKAAGIVPKRDETPGRKLSKARLSSSKNAQLGHLSSVVEQRFRKQSRELTNRVPEPTYDASSLPVTPHDSRRSSVTDQGIVPNRPGRSWRVAAMYLAECATARPAVARAFLDAVG